MGDITQDFFRAVTSGTRWKEAYDLCNGMDMFGMLRALTSLETRFLTELRARMKTYDVWGGPNMPRIAFAMDVVQNRKVPSPAPSGLPRDQVDAAATFLKLTASQFMGKHEGAAVIEEWAARFQRGDRNPNNRFLYPDATPYLAVQPPKGKGWGPVAHLQDKCYGEKLNIAYGLAIHCTTGHPSRSAYELAQNGCLPRWNELGISAHFGIAGDGTVVQFVPTNFQAFAQNEASAQWISVEIDNDSYLPMIMPQLGSAKRLFSWVCRTFAVPQTLATGHISKDPDPDWNNITRTVCKAANVETSPSQHDVIFSRGLSCHRWLKYGQHSCPGKGILAQLATIADPRLVC